MKEFDRVRFPLYPTQWQFDIMIQNCHNARFAYNWGVDKVKKAIDNNESIPSTYSLAKQFNEYKATCGYEKISHIHSEQLS